MSIKELIGYSLLMLGWVLIVTTLMYLIYGYILIFEMDIPSLDVTMQLIVPFTVQFFIGWIVERTGTVMIFDSHCKLHTKKDI